ncbi:hypothetical protein [Sandarakinorhabdus sp.]|uniref:hypothetical protein n=1 Tax=Sandarakinorhabdus sp. TaxID=1916663 RepID=UPI00286E6191|nr:hypothetical protein [Sandarakinorhabdus sp.]
MTSTDHTDDFDLVSQDPAAWYLQPQAVLDDAQLSHAEKGRLLEEWALDIGDRSTAADEGMVAEIPVLVDRDARMQDRIISAQAELALMAANDAALSLPQRLWRRITAAVQGGPAANDTL